MYSLQSPVLRRAIQVGLAASAVACLALSLTLSPAPAQQAQPSSGEDAEPADSPSSTAPGEKASSPAKPSAGKREETPPDKTSEKHAERPLDYWSMLFVFALSTLIGIGVIGRVSRLLHTPLMSLTNAISAIAVVGAIIVCGSDYPGPIRFLGGVALFASMTNIVSGFLITDRMLKMFKTPSKPAANSAVTKTVATKAAV